jgi:hypothetical protein
MAQIEFLPNLKVKKALPNKSIRIEIICALKIGKGHCPHIPKEAQMEK